MTVRDLGLTWSKSLKKLLKFEAVVVDFGCQNPSVCHWRYVCSSVVEVISKWVKQSVMVRVSV